MDRTRLADSRRASSAIGELVRPRLHGQQAADDLEVVLDAVVDLLQQRFLFVQGSAAPSRAPRAGR